MHHRIIVRIKSYNTCNTQQILIIITANVQFYEFVQMFSLLLLIKDILLVSVRRTHWVSS